MLNFSFKGFFAFGLIVLAVIFPLHTGFSQTGAWVSQTISQTMDGWWMYDCGETVAALTRHYSRYIYFFDINSSQWSVVDFGSTQTVRKFAVKGNCAMAYTDSLIVGYSGMTSQWDTLYYRGQVLDPDPSWSGSPSWGTGENLAWFVTDSAAYIFDAELGLWQTFQYSIPFTYQHNYGRFWSRGDYAGIILYDSVQNLYYNLAYSLHAHAFSELPEGGYYQDSDWKFDHGFVAHWDDGSTYKFIGYSAYTNQFAVVSSSVPPSRPTHWIDFDNIITNTVYVFSYKLQTSPPHGYTLYNYGFDTRNGTWIEFTWDYDIGEWNFHGWEAGGQIAMRTLVNTTGGNSYTYLVYDGIHNSFSMHTPGVFDDGGLYGRFLGGTLVADFNRSSIWFYSIEPETSIFLPTISDDFSSTILAEDFIWVDKQLFSQPDSIYVHGYNEITGNQFNVSLPKFKGSPVSTPWLFAHATYGANNEVLFYSGLQDSYSLVACPTAVQSYNLRARGELAAVKVSGFMALFDAANGTVHSENYSYTLSPKLGEHVAVLKKSGTILNAYSSLTHQWYEFNIPDGISWYEANDYIGFCESTMGDDEFYVFDGQSGNLVELIPAGNPVSGVTSETGAKTAIVVRDSIIYAFDPQAVTGISNPNSVSPLPTTFRLEQNFPNPFNPATEIQFTVAEGGYVELKIYDLLGREVKTLVNERKAPGSYTVLWNGTNNAGQPVASGVYLYRLKAGNPSAGSGQIFTAVHKMLLVR